VTSSLHLNAMAERHKSARQMCADTTAVLSSFSNSLPQINVPWMVVICGRMRAMCTYLSVATDSARIKRARGLLDTMHGASAVAAPVATSSSLSSSTGSERSLSSTSTLGGRKQNAPAGGKPTKAEQHPPGNPNATPPLTPASPASLPAAASPLGAGASRSSGASAAVTPSSVTLLPTQASEISALLLGMEQWAWSRERWRTAAAHESAELSRARSTSGAAAAGTPTSSSSGAASSDLLQELLPQLQGSVAGHGADALNVEHLESNTPAQVVAYAKRALAAAAKLYALPPFFREPTVGASISI